MTQLPSKNMRQKIEHLPLSTTGYAEPHALHVDGNGDGWLDPAALVSLSQDNKRFDFTRYIEVRKTPPGVVVGLPANGVWDAEFGLDTTGLLPVLAFTERS
jgi:hypothetical protein